MNVGTRAKVLLIGDRPVERGPFEQRRLMLNKISVEQLGNLELLNSACGVLLASPPKKYQLACTYFREHFRRVCELGLLTAIYVKEDVSQMYAIRDEAYANFEVGGEVEDLQERKKWVEALPWVFIAETDWSTAEVIARHDPGPRLGSSAIAPDGLSEPLDEGTNLILRRAFHDANRITVKPLAGGKVAKGAFCVHANLGREEDASHGPQPMPFFVKVGTPWKIDHESRQYRDVAEPFIPFHLRPALVQSRCVRTLRSAALTCSFVENAAPLRAALRSGQANGVIFSLFEVTLRGLRLHTLSSRPKCGVIESFLDSRVRAAEVESKYPSRMEMLRRQGERRSPSEILTILKERAGRTQCREGHYHGDLHHGNIMARNGDGIVIDFGSTGPFGPLYADPAILEISLVFGTDIHDDVSGFNEWRQFVDDLYSEPLLPPNPTGYQPQLAWLHRAIRELRHVVACCGISTTEALIVLAGCMIRYARHSPLLLRDGPLRKLDEDRRSYALVKAYQLCDRLETPDAAR